MIDMTTKPTKSKLPFLLIGVLIALAIVLFMTFRPVAPQEKVVQDDGEARVYEPVVYDVENWASTPKQDTNIQELKAKIVTTATQEDGLDYYGNHATKYRFSARHEPPLYVVESDEMLEIAWYYAAPKDNDDQKRASLDYAKRIHSLMGAFDGKKGENLVRTILQNPNKPYATTDKGEKVAGMITADCTNYQCRIILQK